jgi:zinc transporter 1/2/3
LPGVIGLGSLFTLFAIEMWMHAKMPGGHSHGSATGQEFSGGAMPPLASASARGPVVTQAMTREDQSPYLDEKKVSDE